LTGPNLLSYDDTLQKICKTVLDIITRKHACQIGMDDEDLDDDDLESSELEWVVIDNGMDVISGLAAALGPSFAELWKMFEKPVLKHASGAESLARASACGVIAEIITGMGSAVTPYTSSIMNILLKRLGDEDAQTKSNAAYAIGRLVEKSDDNATVIKAYPQIMQKLENMLGIKEARCMDNAAGCVSRLIMKHKDKVPVSEVLPALVNSGVLPLKEDYQENEPLWNMIIQLYRENDATVQGLTKQLAPMMISTLGDPEDQLNDETRQALTALVEHLKSTHG
jgi:importin-4